MPKILLTTVCRPFGAPGDGDSVSAELFNAQVTRAQGIFSFRQVIRCWGLDYIADNIEAPCVVMHYPSKFEFIKELKLADYDYIGINFVVSTFYKLKRMIPWIRKHAPKAKIILGGYGTVLPDELLKPYSDFICREEGIGYMRKLLGENTDKPNHLPYVPIQSPKFYSYQMKTKVAHITGGLGCPNGCDFCCTSHFFKRKYVPFINSGTDLYDTMMRMQREAVEQGDEISSFILIDEDFFIHRKRAMEFLECVRKGGKALSIMGFGSVKGLSQFTADEIAEMGFDTIWTAFEGEEAGYGKLQGRKLEDLYNDLKSHGTSLLASMIIGFPYQDTDRIWTEFNRLMDLRPTYAQFLIYFAFPGTPFHKQVIEEGRYLPEYTENPDLRRWDGFAMHFKHDHFDANGLEELQHTLFRQDFAKLGPSIVRAIKVWFSGYKQMRNSENPILRQRAEHMRTYVRGGIPGLYPAMWFGPNRERRREAKTLRNEIIRETGEMTLREKMLCYSTFFLSIYTWLILKFNLFQQPKLMRFEHRIEESAFAFLKGRAMAYIRQTYPGVFVGDVLQNVKWTAQNILSKIIRKKKDLASRIVTNPIEIECESEQTETV